MENGKDKELRIRRAKLQDAQRLAELATQLGYPSTAAQLCQRLRQISPASQNAVFVAEAKDAGVVGWLHVSKQALLESDIRAEVNGLVVKEGYRSRGALERHPRARAQVLRTQRLRALQNAKIIPQAVMSLGSSKSRDSNLALNQQIGRF
jgi:N-acetylglutamate synthase-like GNAT family acetyltransferase